MYILLHFAHLEPEVKTSKPNIHNSDFGHKGGGFERLALPLLLNGCIYIITRIKHYMRMIRTLLNGWDLMRIFRLVMGIVALGQAFYTKELLIGAAGAFLLFMAVANIGCCGVNGCSIKPAKRKSELNEEVSFETVNDK